MVFLYISYRFSYISRGLVPGRPSSRRRSWPAPCPRVFWGSEIHPVVHGATDMVSIWYLFMVSIWYLFLWYLYGISFWYLNGM